MSVVSRGVRNAFRNGLRTSAVVLILAISIGLSLSMLVASKAVEARIAQLKTEVGRTIVINPAGSQGFQGGGEPLTGDDLNAVKSVAEVESASGFMSFMLQTEGQDGTGPTIRMKNGNATPGETNLESSIDAGTLGKRFNANVDGTEVPDIKLPIRGVGTNGSYDNEGKPINITDGRLLKEDDTYKALVGKNLAEKNDLEVGSTFKAYDKTFTVVGIFDQGTEFANDAVVIPLETAQTLTELDNEVSVIIAQADSIENLDAAITAIQEKLGDDADVTTTQQNIQDAIESLKSVQNISIIGFVAALGAAALIVLMVMFVIVRERRREIGVLKAIGGSNRSIVSQFVIEAIVLVAVGGILGLGMATVGSGAIANALVSSNTNRSTTTEGSEFGSSAGPGGGPRTIQISGSGNTLEDTSKLVGEVTTNIGASTLVYGFLGMIAIAMLGSAIPAWLIAKVRPAEVLRGE
jgi:putative ABC transport system permease protein